MTIPPDAVVAPEKLRDYFLVPRPYDDKSKFLGLAGFTRERPEELEDALRTLAATQEAAEDGDNIYGIFYRVTGSLRGPKGQSLNVIAIWLKRSADNVFQFITLKPDKGIRLNETDIV